MAEPEPIGLSIAFDYVDPGSYAALLILDEAHERGDLAGPLLWRPLELRTPGSARLDTRDAEWERMTDRVLAELARIGSEARRPSLVPLTRKAHELACHSKEYDRFDGVHRALFDAYFVSGEDIGRVDVLVRIGVDAGLDAAEMRTVLGVDRYAPAIEDERRRLLEEGIRGVPTLWSEGGRIEGFQGMEAFRAGLDEIVER